MVSSLELLFSLIEYYHKYIQCDVLDLFFLHLSFHLYYAFTKIPYICYTVYHIYWKDFRNHSFYFLLCLLLFVHLSFFAVYVYFQVFYDWTSLIQNSLCVGSHDSFSYHVVAYIKQITILGVLYIYLTFIVLKIILIIVHLWASLVQQYAM